MRRAGDPANATREGPVRGSPQGLYAVRSAIIRAAPGVVNRPPASRTMTAMSTTPPDDRPGLDELRESLRQVIDPEVGLDIVDLGLVYRLEYVGDALEADLTMTSPACPATGMMAADVEQVLRDALPPGMACRVRVVWDPPWDPERISPAGRERLGW